MGWASGGELFSRIAESATKHIKDKKVRAAFYNDAIDAFEDHDCDTIYECQGEDKVLDKVLKERGLLDDEDK